MSARTVLALLGVVLLAVLWALSRPAPRVPVEPTPTTGVDPARADLERSEDGPTLGRTEVGGVDRAEGVARPTDVELTGVLLQEGTDEPLPEYHLSLHAEGRVIRTRTDDEGRFACPCPLGELRVEFDDLPPNPSITRRLEIGVLPATGVPSERLHHSGHEKSHVLRAPSGPTFLLELDRPPEVGLNQLEAELRLNLPYASPFWMDAHRAPIRGEGARTWVRFPPHPQGVRDGPWGVSVRSKDARWISGEAQTARGLGRFPRPLRLRLIGRGWARVVATHAGEPEEWPVVPFVGPVDRPPYEVIDDVAFARHGEAVHERQSTWLFVGLEPGRYEVAIHSQRHVPYRGEFEVQVGELTRHEAELERLAVGGQISGALFTETGTGDPARRVSLVSEEHGLRFEVGVKWSEEAGRKVGHYRFEDVPAGRYWLAPLAKTFHPWEPEGRWIDPPAAAIDFYCRDGGEHAPIGFVVTDADTGAVLEGMRLSLRRRADPPDQGMDAPLTSGKPIHLDFPLAAPIEWAITCPGYVAVGGDGSAFSERLPTPHGDGRFARVALERE